MYEEERSSKSALTRVVLLVALGAAVALAQPSISGLQASSVGGSAANVGSITSGLNLQGGGFWLYINGTFSVGVSPTVTWTNPASPGQSGTLTVQGNPSGTQIVALVPNNFFNPQVNSNQTVGVTVTQNNATSNSFPFLIVPIPVAAPSPLPSATVGVPYSAPVAIGGTEPFSPFSTVGIPAGLQFSNTGDTIVGTPLGPPGTSTITGATNDFWGVTVDLSAQITVLALPTVGAVQSSAGTTYPYGTLTNLSVSVTSPSTPQPTGSVNILDNGLPLVSGALNGTTATVIGVFLPIGTHPLTGHYSGDSIYAAANSSSA